MRGYGDPLFRNVSAPFIANPPQTPRDYNPTGAYRTTFTVPSDWKGEDYWRLAGIFDDVYLYATPKTRLFDWYVTTDLDKEYKDADLRIEATVRSYDDVPVQSPLKVLAVLSDAEGKTVAELESQEARFAPCSKSLTLTMTKHIANPLKWTAEPPDLYSLKMYLIDASTGYGDT